MKESGNPSLSLMRSLSMMRQLGPRQCFLPKQAQDYNSSHSSRMLAVGTKWLCNHYPRWLHLSLSQTRWIWVTRWSKPTAHIQRKHFLHIAKPMCKYVFLGEDSSVTIIRTDAWVWGGCVPSLGPYLPCAVLQAAREPSGVLGIGFWLQHTWTWVLVLQVTQRPWAQSA